MGVIGLGCLQNACITQAFGIYCMPRFSSHGSVNLIRLFAPDCQLICGSEYLLSCRFAIFCNDCIKLKRPSYGRHLGKTGCPPADSDGEADSAAAHGHDDGMIMSTG